MRSAEGAEQRAPQAGAELRPEDGYLQLVLYMRVIAYVTRTHVHCTDC